MRFEHLSSVDHNQMLVVSVFFHLLVMATVVFIPPLTIKEKIIRPAFTVNLVELPAATKSRRLSKSVPKPVEKKTHAKNRVTTKPKTKPVLVKSESTKKILKDLDQLSAALPPVPSLIQELDQVTKLTAKKPVKKARKKPILEDSLRDKKKLEQTIVSLKKNTAAPLVLEKQNERLGKLPFQELEETKTPDFNGSVAKKDQDFKDIEFASMAKKKIDLKKKKDKTAADLLKELEKMGEFKSVLDKKSLDASERAASLPVEIQKEQRSFTKVFEKLDTAPPLHIDIDISPGRLSSEKFESGVRNVKPLVDTSKEVSPIDKSPALLSAKLGREQADVLSFYVGAIKRRVFGKWKNPLGAKNDEAMALVTFRIFKKGNIDKPFIKKSTGNEKLDSLAVRAILDAEPFPALPGELKIPNLHISVQFKYIPEND